MFRAADPDGLAVARFGWADVGTGYAANTRTAAHQMLGFVFPLENGRTAIRTFRGQRYLRPGVQATLMGGGDFWARFANGALAGQQVYASLVDGAPISGQADDAEATPWFVVTDAAPGALAIISTTCKVTA